MFELDAEITAAVTLLNEGKTAEARNLVEDLLARRVNDSAANLVGGLYWMSARHLDNAISFFRRAIELNSENVIAKINLAMALYSNKRSAGIAECRDLLSALAANEPAVFNLHADTLMRIWASCCDAVGPKSQAAALWKAIADKSTNADDHFQLSEALATVTDQLSEPIAALARAQELDPAKYGTSTHREILDDLMKVRNTSAAKRVRYPDTELFHGNLTQLICDHIATEHKKSPRFISPRTVFFTMGSCFARNVARALRKTGYNATHLDIAEHINTTFANRCFIDWLEGAPLPNGVGERVEELMPPGFSRDSILKQLGQTEVFILTLGVAPAFFDRRSGEFVLPRSTALNLRALAEKYEFKTTTVQENVDNVLYFLRALRKLNPDMVFVVTVSPLPLQMTFEFDSAVVADCISKSTLRLVAHQLTYQSGLKNIYYWPSFEIFRWAGSHAGPYYGTDDGAAWHVSEAVVDTTVAAFVDMFSYTSDIIGLNSSSPNAR